MKMLDAPYVAQRPDSILMSLRIERGYESEVQNMLNDMGEFDAEKEYDIAITRRRKKRSLDANAYMWVLCDKIAQATSTSKEAVYRGAIKEVGVFFDTAVQIGEPYKELLKTWQGNGIGWFCESFDSELTDKRGNGMKRVRLYKGSSLYDSKQMSRLIDWIIEEAKTLGIETATPEELQRLMEEWHG